MRAETEIPRPVVFSHCVPQKPLSDFVSLFWYGAGHSQSHARERILPMNTVELIINLARPKTSASGISGPRSKSIIIDRYSTDELLGVHFKPGGAFPFLAFPFGDLHNGNITIADLWDEQRAARLLSQLNEARTIDTKFKRLEQWLLCNAIRPLKHHAAVVFAMDEFHKDAGLLSSAKVAETVNLSQRRLIELFRNEVGVTPKLYCRVQRFRAVIRTIEHQDHVDWADIAISSGYTDQSHFIHDFREFSGLRPTEYLGLRTEHLSHVQFNG